MRIKKTGWIIKNHEQHTNRTDSNNRHQIYCTDTIDRQQHYHTDNASLPLPPSSNRHLAVGIFHHTPTAVDPWTNITVFKIFRF